MKTFSADQAQTAPEKPIAYWLARWRQGDAEAFDCLLPHIYADLHELARAALRRKADCKSLQPTELVHEVLLRLLGKSTMDFENTAHLLHTVARMMRQVLVNRALAANAVKRGGDQRRANFAEAMALPLPANTDMFALDRAIEALARLDARMARTIELHYFVGLGIPEIAGLFELSERTVNRDMVAARAWLRQRLEA
jgi:RNA polymerase sigma factor (TIGR02999 family)